jgi:hypothetical protein
VHRWVAGAAAIVLSAGTAACGGNAEGTTSPSGALAIVVGAHANAPAPRLTGGAAAALDMAVTQQSQVSLVVADGAPFQEGQTRQLGGQDGATRQRVSEAVSAAVPRSPETDLLAALQLAGQLVAGQPGVRTVVVVDPGLSTTGALDFTQPGMLDAAPHAHPTR